MLLFKLSSTCLKRGKNIVSFDKIVEMFVYNYSLILTQVTVLVFTTQKPKILAYFCQ